MLHLKQVAVFSTSKRYVLEAFSGIKLSFSDARFYFSGPESDVHLSVLLGLLSEGRRDTVVRAIQAYLHTAESGPAAAAFIARRLSVLMNFMDRSYQGFSENYDEKITLKLLFFELLLTLKSRREWVGLPSPVTLNLCRGISERMREFDTDSGKHRVVVPLSQGRLVCDNQWLGKGYFATVKTAKHYVGDTWTHVAIKRIRLPSVPYQKVLRGLQEATLPMRLGPHPNIVPVYDFYIYGDGKKQRLPKQDNVTCRPPGNDFKVAIVMPKAVMSLDKLRFADTTLKSGAKKLMEAAMALAHMEAFGYMHNDFKVSNVFLFENEQIKLGDFGISRVLGEREPADVLGGTYLPPEAVAVRDATYQGSNFSKIDTFSFGVTLFHLLYRKTIQRELFSHEKTATNYLYSFNLYEPDFKNAYLGESDGRVVPGKTLNPVVGFLEKANRYCCDLQKRFPFSKSRFIHDLAALSRDCLAFDPADRPKMRDVVLRLQDSMDDLDRKSV
jgi:serine/threonine protein kinase